MQNTTTLQRLCRGDIPELCGLYEAIRITAENCGERLSPDAPRSFSRAGGMFAIPSRLDLERMAEHTGQYVTCVARSETGDMVGFLWAPLEPADPEWLKSIQYSRYEEELRETLELAAAENALLWGGEILVHPQVRISGLALRMFGALFSHLSQSGYTHKLGEVYRVAGYRADHRFRETDCYNVRSHRLLLRTAGRPIGVLPERTLELPGFSPRIRPVVFYWNIPQAANRLRALTAPEGERGC